ncbi:MAG: hypothetical protein Kapaf2KO_20800 [Candidatus Kapaibacteriales bacterium]
MLIIEVDGEIHNETTEYDQWRTEILATKGYTVIRFENDNLINKGIWVEKEIKKVINDLIQPPA